MIVVVSNVVNANALKTGVPSFPIVMVLAYAAKQMLKAMPRR
jgi:hypothetical protein